MGLDVKGALRAYVLGRDVGYDVAAKGEMAAEEPPAPELPPIAGGTGGDGGGPGEGPSADAGTRGGRFGVPVPERLDFHRSASTWRDNIPGLRRGGA